jgi:hypothetical protein
MRKRLLDMDVAWMLGDESKKDDWELRMSMRSFWVRFGERSGYWIIGHIPRWIDTQQVRCIPWPDPYKHCKDANLLLKALRLTMEPELLAYADSVKQQKADEFLAKLRAGGGTKPPEGTA